MDKRTKRQINKKVLAFEKECLLEMLIESDDENVKDALEQALIAVKLIHSEEIAEEVEELRQKLIEEAKNKKVELQDFKRLFEQMERDLERKEKDVWKKKSYDYWDNKYSDWITTSTISIDKSPVDYTKLFSNKWSRKLDKK